MTIRTGLGSRGRFGKDNIVGKKWFGAAATLAWLGCAAPATAMRPPAADMRGNALVSGREAQPLLAGPMKLLHVNSDGRAEPKLSHVWQRNGAVDCHNGTPLDWDGQSAVEIGENEMVCVTLKKTARVSWHGRSLSRGAPALPQQASLHLPAGR